PSVPPPPPPPPSPPPAPTAPVISAVTSAVTNNSATITWTTDKSSDSVVDYGTTTVYGQSVTIGSLSTSHSANLSGLNSGTAYHFRVKSKDAAGNVTVSGDFTLTTSAADPVVPPTVVAVGGYSMPSVEDEKATYRRWGWTWNTSQEPNNILTSDPYETLY